MTTMPTQCCLGSVSNHTCAPTIAIGRSTSLTKTGYMMRTDSITSDNVAARLFTIREARREIKKASGTWKVWARKGKGAGGLTGMTEEKCPLYSCMTEPMFLFLSLFPSFKVLPSDRPSGSILFLHFLFSFVIFF